MADTPEQRLDKLEQRLDRLEERLDRRLEPPPAPAVDVTRPIHRPGRLVERQTDGLTVRRLNADTDFL